MDKKLTRFYIFLLILVLFLFTLLSPKISSFLYPFKRGFLLDSFLSDTQAHKTIDPQKFWQFRDFYYPGIINFDKRGLRNLDSFSLVEDSPINLGKQTAPFLHYSSKLIESYEMLVTNATSPMFSLNTTKNWNILYQNVDEMIISNDKEILIVFVKPASEMVKANGFFDYKDKDKKLLENKSWYVVTKIQK